MKIGHVYLTSDSADSTTRFATLVESLDRLTIDQHVLVSNALLARRLQSCPYVTVGPVVRTPVMAYCLMPNVDLVHIHDTRSGQVGLLLTLTRSTPFVMTYDGEKRSGRNPIRQSILGRAQAMVSPSELDTEAVISIYRKTVDSWSELPQDANCG